MDLANNIDQDIGEDDSALPNDPLLDAFDWLDEAFNAVVVARSRCDRIAARMPDKDKRNPRALIGMCAETDGVDRPVYAHSHDEIDAVMDRMVSVLESDDAGGAETVGRLRLSAHAALDKDAARLRAAMKAAGLTDATKLHDQARRELDEARRHVSRTAPINLQGCALLAQFMHERSIAAEPDITMIATAARHLSAVLARLVLDREIGFLQ